MTLQFPTRVWLVDAVERVLWTAAQAVVATLIVVIADLDPLYVAVLTPILTAVKTAVARKLGDPSTAAIGEGSVLR